MPKKILAEYEAEKFLSRHAPVAKSVLVKKDSQLAAAIKATKLPAAMKIISKDALHKSGKDEKAQA